MVVHEKTDPTTGLMTEASDSDIKLIIFISNISRGLAFFLFPSLASVPNLAVPLQDLTTLLHHWSFESIGKKESNYSLVTLF